MPEKLTAAQAKALRFLMSADSGMIHVSDPQIALTIRDLPHTRFASISITADGYRALAEYDAEHREGAIRARIAAGMSEAGDRDAP